MSWKRIRLELARTPEFPQGSAGIAYLIDLPLDEQGMVDLRELARSPDKALVLRSWPEEPDHSGYLVRTDGGWSLSYEPGEEDDENIFRLESHVFRPGEYLTLTEPDGRRLPFRVVTVQSLN